MRPVRLVTYTLNGADSARVGQLLDEHVRELAAPSMIAWLDGEGRGATGVEHALDEETEALLKPCLCDAKGRWMADYVRLRVEAVKP